MNAERGYGQLHTALDVQHARRAIANEQLVPDSQQQLASPTRTSPNKLAALQHPHHRGPSRTHRSPQRKQSQSPHKQRAWWHTEHDPSVDQHEVLAKQRQLQDDVRRQEQNAWLGKHAKQRRFEFSASQKRMLRQWFNALDADGSGKISVEELEDPMLSIGIVTDPVEIKEIVEKLDKDANGLIDFQEFVDFLTPHTKHKASHIEKHEAMFMKLTKTMEHQSAGFLDINTQLSMERRRFILDAITHSPTQSIADELLDLRITHHPRSTDERNDTHDSSSELYSSSNTGASAVESRARRAVARRHKLEALKSRHQVEVRYQALEKVFERNSSVKPNAVLALDRLAVASPLGGDERLRRGDERLRRGDSRVCLMQLGVVAAGGVPRLSESEPTRHQRFLQPVVSSSSNSNK